MGAYRSDAPAPRDLVQNLRSRDRGTALRLPMDRSSGMCRHLNLRVTRRRSPKTPRGSMSRLVSPERRAANTAQRPGRTAKICKPLKPVELRGLEPLTPTLPGRAWPPRRTARSPRHAGRPPASTPPRRPPGRRADLHYGHAAGTAKLLGLPATRTSRPIATPITRTWRSVTPSGSTSSGPAGSTAGRVQGSRFREHASAARSPR